MLHIFKLIFNYYFYFKIQFCFNLWRLSLMPNQISQLFLLLLSPDLGNALYVLPVLFSIFTNIQQTNFSSSITLILYLCLHLHNPITFITRPQTQLCNITEDNNHAMPNYIKKILFLKRQKCKSYSFGKKPNQTKTNWNYHPREIRT